MRCCRAADAATHRRQGTYRRLFAWGRDRYGQLGVGGRATVQGVAASAFACTPTQVQRLNWPVLQPLGACAVRRAQRQERDAHAYGTHALAECAGQTLSRVVAGLDHNIAFTAERALYAWGRNDQGKRKRKRMRKRSRALRCSALVRACVTCQLPAFFCARRPAGAGRPL
jgi:alpha-tubulin suppressor-like RCC1 family protein